MPRHPATFGDVMPEVRSQALAARHVRSELTNDPDTILETITSAEPLLTAIIEQRPEGQQLTVCTSVAEQRRHYEQNRAEMKALEAEIYTSIGSEWYAFLHGSMTVRKFATDELRRNEWVGLFPVAPHVDAIGGEIGLSWPPSARRGEQAGTPSNLRGATIKTFEAWLSAVRAGDSRGAAACYEPDALAAVRPNREQAPLGLRGASDIESFYDETFAAFGIESVEIVTRVVDRWFLFAELAWRVRDRDAQELTRRTAHVMVMTDADLIAIELGHGTDFAGG